MQEPRVPTPSLPPIGRLAVSRPPAGHYYRTTCGGTPFLESAVHGQPYNNYGRGYTEETPLLGGYKLEVLDVVDNVDTDGLALTDESAQGVVGVIVGASHPSGSESSLDPSDRLLESEYGSLAQSPFRNRARETMIRTRVAASLALSGRRSVRVRWRPSGLYTSPRASA